MSSLQQLWSSSFLVLYHSTFDNLPVNTFTLERIDEKGFKSIQRDRLEIDRSCFRQGIVNCSPLAHDAQGDGVQVQDGDGAAEVVAEHQVRGVDDQAATETLAWKYLKLQENKICSKY